MVVGNSRKKAGRRNRLNAQRKPRAIIDNPSDEEGSFKRINEIMTKKCGNIEILQYSEHIFNLLVKALADRKLTTIWAIGIGPFLHSYHFGCDQLAVLLKLNEFFGCQSTDLFTYRLIDSDDDQSAVLLYAPHCGLAMYNSLIYAHRKELKRVVIIGLLSRSKFT
ncbi:unnamed protein product [Gongylonema pulchrum]|uniref:SRR1 domain-containing protein n=1 Tax=Gongylonema pulchrum TaxID=637853 RepID=A0A183E5H3_9BILA|nr:unnamed protein product [Gongylonema pulchrum]